MADADQMDGLIHPSFPAQGTPRGAHEGSQSKSPVYGDQANDDYEHYDSSEAMEKGQIREQMFQDKYNENGKYSNRSKLQSGSYEVERTAKRVTGRGTPDRY